MDRSIGGALVFAAVMGAMGAFVGGVTLGRMDRPPVRCYLDGLETRTDRQWGTIWYGVCDDGTPIEIAEHD